MGKFTSRFKGFWHNSSASLTMCVAASYHSLSQVYRQHSLPFTTADTSLTLTLIWGQVFDISRGLYCEVFMRKLIQAPEFTPPAKKKLSYRCTIFVSVNCPTSLDKPNLELNLNMCILNCCKYFN